jgi:sugar phosphate isomerase/epimerase
MRVGPDNFFHLTYCTNIHPGESWPEVESNLIRYTLPLKDRLSPDSDFGVGLRLSNQAARHLIVGDHLQRLREWLDEHGLYVFTLNGFPYGSFHRQIVKDHVYEPDWRTQERVDYTLILADVLAELLPPGFEGSISTSPISYKPWLSGASADDAKKVGARNLTAVAAKLNDLYDRTGTLIHIGIEPEPDCLIENTAETVEYFEKHLFSTSSQVDTDSIRRHIRVCYDTCHFAVEFEDPAETLARFDNAGILLSKVQISSALRVLLGQDRHALAADLQPFAESTYLHQVVGRDAEGRLSHYPDLPAALPQIETSRDVEWRVHYHVPIFTDGVERLLSTQRDITDALDDVLSNRRCPHLEIETYTWDVLPAELKTDAVASIEREFDWILNQISG